MIIPLLLAVPFFAAVTAILLPARLAAARRWLVPAAGLVHAALTAWLWICPASPSALFSPWLHPDHLGLLFLALTSGLFVPAGFYAVGDMRRYAALSQRQGISERLYVAGLLFFLMTMTAVCLAQDMGLMWVAVEATTLATAPLIYFRKSPGALEATWKYLLICSVGIALALLGTFILAVAASNASSGLFTLRVRALAYLAPLMDPALVRAAFIFLLVGYGAKMGLAPMHTWLPDAHAESPSPVSALLSGTLLNGAFLAILRGADIVQSAGLDAFSGQMLRLFGLVSMGIAGAFILGQRDFKRLLAYSSVEHMGILAFGAGIGGAGLWAALFHAVNHTFAKGCLFMTAGNIMFRYHDKSTLTVKGVRRGMPINGALWLAGFLAICGLPPFGIFLSEFSIIIASFSSDRAVEGVLFLVFLAVVFIGMLTVVLGMLRGAPPPLAEGEKRESTWMALPGLVALTLVAILGFGVPGFLAAALSEAAVIIDNDFVFMPGIRP